MHQDENRNTVQVVLDHKNLRGDAPYMLLVPVVLLKCADDFVVKLLGHQELVCLFRYVDRLYS